MNEPPRLTVTLDPTHAGTATRHEEVLASLPARWRITHDVGDVAVVFGGRPDWVGRAGAALATGCRALLVTRPSWTEPGAVTVLAADAAKAGAIVAVESSYLADPTWTRMLPALREHVGDAVVVDSVATVPTADTVSVLSLCIEQLALVQTIVGSVDSVGFRQIDLDSYVFGGNSKRGVLNLVGTRGGCGAERLALDLVGMEKAWRIRFDQGAPARPSAVERLDSSGFHRFAQTYETGRRGIWAELHEAILQSAPVSYGLSLLTECLRLTSVARVPLPPEARSNKAL
jgi:hypothetical protein